MSDACVAAVGADPLVVERPGCVYPPAGVFWRWPGNVVVVPSEPGLGTCHDDAVEFPARTATCAPAPRVSVEEPGVARSRDGAAVLDHAAAVVQVGITEMPVAMTRALLAEVDRVAGPRVALRLVVTRRFDLAWLAPIADRLVFLDLEILGWDEDAPSELSLDRLPPMPQLETLWVAFDGHVTDLSRLRTFPALRGLAVGPVVDPGELAAIAALEGLEVLAIPGEHPRLLRRLRRLRRAQVDGTLANVRALERLPRLSSLALQGVIGDDALTRAALIPSLRHLAFGLDGYSGRAADRVRHAHRLETIVVHAGFELERPDRLVEVSGLAAHPTARVILDADEPLACELPEPWHGAVCPDLPLDAPAPDPTAAEVDPFLQ